MQRSVALCALSATALLGCGDTAGALQGGDPLNMDPCQVGGAQGGNRWSDLYACYFGPSGKASCGSRQGCHGADAANAGFLCVATQEGCWQGMTTSIVPSGGTTAPTNTLLYGALRKPGGASFQMPLKSTYVFQTADVARINAWIQQGAKDN